MRGKRWKIDVREEVEAEGKGDKRRKGGEDGRYGRKGEGGGGRNVSLAVTDI